MRVDDALKSVQDIRQQLGVVDKRRPFRSISIGISGGVALLVPFFSGCQLKTQFDFLLLWYSVAIASIVLVGLELVVRKQSDRSRLNTQWIGDLVRQMVPTIVMCIALTWVSISNPSLEGILPPIWAIFYGLGLVACGKLLPKICRIAIAYLLVAGILTMKNPMLASLPMSTQMALLFGIGQVTLSACLFVGVKSDDEG